MRTASLVVPFLLSLPLAAQATGPAPELAQLDRLIGTWEGSGKVHMGPGAPASDWKATATYKKVLGGHFVQCDEHITFPEDSKMPGSLVFRSLSGWDRETKSHRSWTVSNMGTVQVARIHWLDNDTMVTCDAGTEDGKPKVERWTTRLGKDSMTFVGHHAIGDGELSVHVEGSMKRAKDVPQPVDASAVTAFLPPGAGSNEHLAKLGKLLGTYAVKGELVMVPGQPAMPISGTETLTSAFGGTIVEGVIHGDPAPGMPGGPYESWGAWGWDEERGCYLSLCADSMGMCGVMEVRWVGNDLVATMSGTENGSPMVLRTIMKCGPDGALASATCHSLSATHDPYVSFKATYTKKK
jgi:hypothetical protein